MVSKRNAQNNDYGIKIPFTPLSITFYLILLSFVFIRLFKKKKLINDNFGGKIIEKELKNEYNPPIIEMNDESTMNNLDEINDDNKTINSNSSINIINKSKQIGFDIFESTLKELNSMNESETFSSTSNKLVYHEPQIKDNSVFLRKFKNSLINGHNKQNENIHYLRHHINSNSNNNNNNNNNFEQDYKKERFLSNTKINKQNHLLGIITTQQTALKNHNIINSNSQLSTNSFISASDYFVHNKKN